MSRIILIASGALVAAAGPAGAATVLYCPFDSLAGWTVRTAGASRAAIAGKSDKSRCLEVASNRGTVLVSRELPLEAVRGCRITVSCAVKAERIVRGPQASSTAKIHLAIQAPAGIAHHAARFAGTSDWHSEGFTADVPADAKRVLLNLGLESCFGRALFDRLIVRSDRRGVYRLDLSPAANAGHEQLQLAAFPAGAIDWQGVPFQVMDGGRHEGLDCLRLKGIDHPDWPQSTASPIAVNKGASVIHILHGALGGQEKRQTPCALWTATFAGGHAASFSVFEGRDIGAVGATKDLANWHVAWRGGDPSGKPVTFGVTRWRIYGEAPVVSLSCRAYRGAAPVVLAVTVVEEPPAAETQPQDEEDDDTETSQ